MHAQEERLRRLEGTNVLILRPGPFFENLYGILELIKHEGISGDAFAPDVPLPMIATREVEVARAATRGGLAPKSAAIRRTPRPHDLRTSQTSWHAPTKLRENHAYNNLLAGSLAIGASL